MACRSYMNGTARIDSSMSSVPGIWAANGQALASGTFSVFPRSAAVPVMPSPTATRRFSSVSPAYSSIVPRNATGSSVCPSSSRTYTRALW